MQNGSPGEKENQECNSNMAPCWSQAENKLSAAQDWSVVGREYPGNAARTRGQPGQLSQVLPFLPEPHGPGQASVCTLTGSFFQRLNGGKSLGSGMMGLSVIFGSES
jgi:hypothetical protein